MLKKPIWGQKQDFLAITQDFQNMNDKASHSK